MNRQEFPRSAKVAIIRRATRDGVVYCESCGSQTKRWEIDHRIADALKIDKTRKLTADDGWLLCKDGGRKSCHGKKTAEQDVPAIAKAKRREAKHLGAKPKPKAPIPAPPRSEAAEKRKATPFEPANGMPQIFRRFLSGKKGN
jgi:hypothetical protein